MNLSPDFLKRISSVLLQTDDLIIKPALALRQADIVQKGTMYDEGDFVTSIDRDAEAFLLDALRRDVVDAYAVGEESFDDDRAAHLARLSQGYAWIVDPLDGTNNVKKFVAGETDEPPRYGVMAALLKDEHAIAGWILACHGDQRKLACGGVESGAFMYDLNTENLQPLHFTASKQPVENMMLVTTVKAFPQDYQDIINANVSAGQVRIYATPPKSAAHEIMMMLDGEVDAAPFRQFHVWDHLPGLAIVRAAGGHVRLMNGEEPTLADQRRSGILFAPDAASWHGIRRNLLGEIVYDHTETLI